MRLPCESREIQIFKPFVEKSVITTTTTVQWEKIRGLSVDILLILLDEPKTLNMIATTTSKDYRTVYRYLYNLRKYGLVQFNDGWWHLNYDMIEVIDFIFKNRLDYIEYNKIRDIIYSYYERNMKEIGKKYERNMKETSKCKVNSLQMSNSLRGFHGAVIWLREHGCSAKQIEVVEVLVNHFKETRQPFILVDSPTELAVRYGFNSISLQNDLARLRELGVIYICRDVTGKWKIGLKKHFINRWGLRNWR